MQIQAAFIQSAAQRNAAAHIRKSGLVAATRRRHRRAVGTPRRGDDKPAPFEPNIGRNPFLSTSDCGLLNPAENAILSYVRESRLTAEDLPSSFAERLLGKICSLRLIFIMRAISAHMLHGVEVKWDLDRPIKSSVNFVGPHENVFLQNVQKRFFTKDLFDPIFFFA